MQGVVPVAMAPGLTDSPAKKVDVMLLRLGKQQLWYRQALFNRTACFRIHGLYEPCLCLPTCS